VRGIRAGVLLSPARAYLVHPRIVRAIRPTHVRRDARAAAGWSTSTGTPQALHRMCINTTHGHVCTRVHLPCLESTHLTSLVRTCTGSPAAGAANQPSFAASIWFSKPVDSVPPRLGGNAAEGTRAAFAHGGCGPRPSSSWQLVEKVRACLERMPCDLLPSDL
jgi:hypothetical protein